MLAHQFDLVRDKVPGKQSSCRLNSTPKVFGPKEFDHLLELRIKKYRIYGL
jgi:hypothetical protein